MTGLTLMAAGLLSICAAGCRESQWQKTEGAAWATTYHMTYRAPQSLADSVTAVMKTVELSLSPFNPSSAVSRINAGVTDSVDALFERVFATSQLINAASGGLYDPTVAPLVNLWGFGYKTAGVEPDSLAVDSCRRMVDIASCRVAAGRIVRGREGMEFDFSSITKGLGCDMVGEMLTRNGSTDYMVEIGGEMALSGRNPRGEKWHVMIDAPVDTDTASALHNRMVVIEVTDCGVATSGNYRNFKQTPSGRVWHSISPATGRPAVTDVLSATVVAPTAMEADALATACMVMDAGDAMAMIETMDGVEALLVKSDGVGGYRLVASSGFPEMHR